MLFDAFKIVVWLIEKYDLHEEVREKLSKPEDDEAIMVQPHTHYLMHFDKPAVTTDELVDKILECDPQEVEDYA